MLNPQQLESLPYSTIKLYRQLEDYILADISRRIAKAGYITDTAEWQILRIKELGEAADNIKKEIARITKLSEKEVEQLFFDSAQMSTSFYDDIYKASGLPPISLADNKSLMQLLDAGIKQTNHELKNFTQSLGFAVDVAGQTVFKPIAKVYQDALDFAQFQVPSGAVDYITATRQAVKKLADSGIRFVDYKTGWINHADVAVRRATLTGIGQITGKISEQTANDLDTDIVETTAHSGARPDHQVWQGKWFSLSGKSDKYPSLVAVTGYGTGAGLKGWNCRHDFFPVVPGISEPAYSADDLKNIDPPPFEYEGKNYSAYEATQQQRIIETAMRKSKRELIGFDASGDKEAFTTSSIKLRRQKELYSEFSKKAGLKTQLERTQVLDFDRSKAQKSRQDFEKALLPNRKNAIITDEKVTEYALNKNHPVGKNKAIAFEKYLGYTVDNKDLLIKEIRSGLNKYICKEREPTKFGKPFEVSMHINGANGKTAKVKTGWIIDKDGDTPRLTTIYVDE